MRADVGDRHAQTRGTGVGSYRDDRRIHRIYNSVDDRISRPVNRIIDGRQTTGHDGPVGNQTVGADSGGPYEFQRFETAVHNADIDVGRRIATVGVGGCQRKDAAALHRTGIGRTRVGRIEVCGRAPAVRVRLRTVHGRMEEGGIVLEHRRVAAYRQGRYGMHGQRHAVAGLELRDATVRGMGQYDAQFIAVVERIEADARGLSGQTVAVQIPGQRIRFVGRQAFNIGVEGHFVAETAFVVTLNGHAQSRHRRDMQVAGTGINVLTVIAAADHAATERHARILIHIIRHVRDEQGLTAVYETAVGGRDIGIGRAEIGRNLPYVIVAGIIVIHNINRQRGRIAGAGVHIRRTRLHARTRAYFDIDALVIGVTSEIVYGAEIILMAAARLGDG